MVHHNLCLLMVISVEQRRKQYMESVRLDAASISWQILRTEIKSDVDTLKIKKNGVGH